MDEGPYRSGSGRPPRPRRPVWARWAVVGVLEAIVVWVAFALSCMEEPVSSEWRTIVVAVALFVGCAPAPACVKYLVATADQGWWRS